MIFLGVLLVGLVVTRLATGPRRSARDQVRIALAAAMICAGVTHFVFPTPFIQHLPDWVPARLALVWASGALEVALGFALVWLPRWRMGLGRALGAYLLAVFPANIYVAVAAVDVVGQPGGLYPWLRLPLQLLFIWLAVWSTSEWDRDARMPVTRATAS